MARTIVAASGLIEATDLGLTLMRVHVTLHMAGSEANALHPGPDRVEVMARSLDWVAQRREHGSSPSSSQQRATWGATLNYAPSLVRAPGSTLPASPGCSTSIMAAPSIRN